MSALPAAARPVPPVEASYAAVLRSINPHLPVGQARAYARSIVKDATRTHLDPRFIMSIVTVESHWEANAISRVGARGLGQLMPHTAALLGVNAWSPYDNLRGTASYLKSLVATFAGHKNAMSLAIAGYNAGPKAVQKYHGIPPYAETQTYVTRVLHMWNILRGKVGRAFAPGPAAVAVRRVAPPDEREWISGRDTIVPPVVPAAVNPTTTAPAASTDAATNGASATSTVPATTTAPVAPSATTSATN
ncbi:MAG TPA: transglycosylase SLT domain-containing protein [Candidatus Sulfotelmatobacter sp.]|nr:transglycosylase SLT domain-containing protein [Candidatus Sulfotelmatobacter sp.]